MQGSRKQFIKFSLRSLFLVFIFLSCTVAYFARVKRQQAEVGKIVSELGGDLWNVNLDEGGIIEPSRIEFLPSWFYLILPEKYNYVYVPSHKIDDEKLAIILRLPGIEGLNISTSSITDKGVRMLQTMSSLKRIHLQDIPTITEEAILQLKSSNDGFVLSKEGDVERMLSSPKYNRSLLKSKQPKQ